LLKFQKERAKKKTVQKQKHPFLGPKSGKRGLYEKNPRGKKYPGGKTLPEKEITSKTSKDKRDN